MKTKIFLSNLFFLVSFSLQYLNANEAKMIKGLEIFNETAGCAVCHSLKAAGAVGNIGPNLDNINPTFDEVNNIVFYGLGSMPAFGVDGILSNEEIDIVSFYVVQSVGK
jgi:cytochrome c6